MYLPFMSCRIGRLRVKLGWDDYNFTKIVRFWFVNIDKEVLGVELFYCVLLITFRPSVNISIVAI